VHGHTYHHPKARRWPVPGIQEYWDTYRAKEVTLLENPFCHGGLPLYRWMVDFMKNLMKNG
jgi:hypothetical protein